MAKKLVSVAALWLALAALVFIYTDRNEYTWRYEEETLDQILIGGEEAERNEQRYQDAMAKAHTTLSRSFRRRAKTAG